MRVLVINRFYWPDESSTAMLATDLAEDLAAAGHDVEVVCARILHDGPARLPATEVRNGVRVRRLFSTAGGRLSLWRRVGDLGIFSAALFAAGPRCARPDVVLVMTDPPLSLLGAQWISLLRGGRVIHHVMDFYPDIALALRPGPVSSIGAGLLSAIYTRALLKCPRIVALSEPMAASIRRRGVPPERVAVLPPWSDGAAVRPLPPESNAFRRELGAGPDDFVVMYSGNMGRAHVFSTILEGVRRLATDPRFRFVFVGGGPRRREIAEALAATGSARATLHPLRPRERLGETLAAADVHLVSQDPRSVGLILPSKMTGALAAGRPIVFVGDPEAEVARVVREARCGVAVRDGDADGFVAALRELADDPRARREAGDRGRALFEARYDRRVVVPRLVAEIEAAARPSPAARAEPKSAVSPEA